ncbi:MAG: DUF2508 family protein [Cellulosilyticaceae bacterium]
MGLNDKKIEDEKIKEEINTLINEIALVQDEMAVALNNFSDTVDPALLEYYTYYYKANQIKYDYLLRRLKKIYYI